MQDRTDGKDQEAAPGGGAPARAVPPRTIHAGRAPDCADCGHWTPGRVVLRGNTRGRCRPMDVATSADFGCDAWVQASGGAA